MNSEIERSRDREIDGEKRERAGGGICGSLGNWRVMRRSLSNTGQPRLSDTGLLTNSSKISNVSVSNTVIAATSSNREAVSKNFRSYIVSLDCCDSVHGGNGKPKRADNPRCV
jgi:hypothetical protein